MNSYLEMLVFVSTWLPVIAVASWLLAKGAWWLASEGVPMSQEKFEREQEYILECIHAEDMRHVEERERLYLRHAELIQDYALSISPAATIPAAD